MIYYASLDRAEFLAWIGRKHAAQIREWRDRDFRKDLTEPRVSLLWNGRPELAKLSDNLPLIVLPENDMREFFAFVHTYVSTYRPFSAFFRVIAEEDFDEQISDEPRQAGDLLEKVFAGTMIAEAWMQSSDQIRKLSDVSIQSCLATMSGAAASHLSISGSLFHLDKTLGSWISVRAKLGDDHLRVDPTRIADFWMTAAGALGGFRLQSSQRRDQKMLSDFVGAALSHNAELTSAIWDNLTIGLDSARTALPAMNESREVRVRAMDHAAIRTLEANRVDPQRREIVLGYLASRVAGGSFAYINLLQDIEQALPLSTLWFALFSSIMPDSDVLTFGDCLGRRLQRNLRSIGSIFASPTSDICAHELAAIASGGRFEGKFRTAHQSIVSVEIMPNVVSVFRMRGSTNRVQPNPATTEKQRAALKELRMLAKRIEDIVNSATGPDEQAALPLEKPRAGVYSNLKQKRTKN